MAQKHIKTELNLHSNKITKLGDGTDNTDALNKGQIVALHKWNEDADGINYTADRVSIGSVQSERGEVLFVDGAIIEKTGAKSYRYSNINNQIPATSNADDVLVIPIWGGGCYFDITINWFFYQVSTIANTASEFNITFYGFNGNGFNSNNIRVSGHNPFSSVKLVGFGQNMYGLCFYGYNGVALNNLQVEIAYTHLYSNSFIVQENYVIRESEIVGTMTDLNPTTNEDTVENLYTVFGKIRQTVQPNLPSGTKFAVFDADGVIGYRDYTPGGDSPWAPSGADITRDSGKVIIGQAASASPAKVQITDASQLLQLGAALFESAAAASIKSSGDLQIGNDSGLLSYFALNHIFKTNGLERMRLTSVGDLLLGTALTGFNTRMVINPGLSQASLLAYLNNNVAEAFTVKKGSDVALNVRTTINDNAVEISEPGGDFPLKIYSGSQTMEAEESYGNVNDFSVAGVPKEEIYERRNAAHFRNGSASFQLYLNVETDAVQTSNARFIMQVEGQASDNPFDIRFIVNQNDFTVTPYGNNADLPSMTITASLNSSNKINVQIGSSNFAFTCLSVHMRKHARFHSANPIPQITDIYTAADASIN